MKVGSMLPLRVAGCAGCRGVTKSSIGKRFGRWLMLLGLLCLLGSADALAQQVSGTVRDAQTGDPLPGVNVVVKGTTLGTATDLEGRYSLTVPSLQDTLVFSFVGYETREEPIAGRSVVEVMLESTAIQGREIVVIGYGMQRRESLTGSVATISTDQLAQLAKIPVPSVVHMLQGVVPGVQLLDGGNRPGRNALDLLVRGQGTLGRGDPGDKGASRPLIIVDGIADEITSLNPDDIESITVLKDAAAASIYGARAANGVILITTKRGRVSDKPQISYSGYVGIQDITAWPKRVDIATYMKLANVARENLLKWCLDGRDPTARTSDDCYNNPNYAPRYTEDYIQNTLSGTDPDRYPNNEWVDAIFSPDLIQEHSLQISGGNVWAKYLLSLSYMDEKGLMPNTGANWYRLRLNTDFQASERLNGGLNISGSRLWDVIPAEDWASTFYIVHDTPPTRRTRYSDGTYGLNLFGRSPLASAEISGNEQRIWWDATVTGRLNYEIVDWGELQFLAAFNYGTMDWEFFRTDPAFIKEYPPEGYYWGPNFGENRDSWWIETTLRTQFNYNYALGSTHSFSGVIGYEQIRNTSEEFRAWRDRFYNNELRFLNMGDPANDGNLGFGSEWALRSWYGRLSYTLLDRYLLEFNARYDGSSRFAKGHRYGFFPSVSVGWRISSESFFRVDWIDELKIRASWGQLGNQDVPLYSYYPAVNLNTPYYLGDASGPQALGGAITDLVNEKLTWETTTVTNIGLDATFFDGRFNFTAEVYKRLTDDILLRLPIPAMVGRGAPFQNAGAVENKGWEVNIGWQDVINDFSYRIDFNLSDNINKVVDLAGTGPYILGGNLDRRIVEVGTAINSWYGWEAIGLFNSYDQIDNSPQPAGWITRLGDIIFKDQNGDGVINEEDRVIIGDPNPRYIFGLNVSLTWKNIDISALFQGIGKRDQYLALGFVQGPVWENYTSAWHLDYWTPDNQDARHPAYYSNYNRNYYNMNSWWILDGSFVKLRNLQIGYTLPNSFTQRLGLQRLRIYFNGKNLWMHHNLGIDLDPEYPWTVADYYPQTKVLSVGIDINF